MNLEGPRAPRVGDVVDERYHIERRLGIGAMAVVYAARELASSRRVALKWLRPELQDDETVARRFLREVKAAQRVRHPHVVEVHEVVRSSAGLYMTLELLEGQTLDDLLVTRTLSVAEAVQLMVPVLRGLSAAHGVGIIHRDLKPENIFLTRATSSALGEPLGSPKVLDFGISKFVVEAEVSGRITSAGTVVGTPAYMAPEQIRGANATPRVDVYAAGVVLYESLSGHLPFEAPTVRGTFEKVVSGDATPIEELVPELDGRLATVIMRAIATDPLDRYPGAESLANALSAVVQRRAGWLPHWLTR